MVFYAGYFFGTSKFCEYKLYQAIIDFTEFAFVIEGVLELFSDTT
jgi:hypothetical protein